MVHNGTDLNGIYTKTHIYRLLQITISLCHSIAYYDIVMAVALLWLFLFVNGNWFYFRPSFVRHSNRFSKRAAKSDDERENAIDQWVGQRLTMLQFTFANARAQNIHSLAYPRVHSLEKESRRYSGRERDEK